MLENMEKSQNYRHVWDFMRSQGNIMGSGKLY